MIVKVSFLFKTTFFALKIFHICSIGYSQSSIPRNHQILPLYRLFNDYKMDLINGNKKTNKKLHLILNTQLIYNNGHQNIDNNAEIFSRGRLTRFNSFRFSYSGDWYLLEFEPYQLESQGNLNSFDKNIDLGTYQINNNLLLNDNDIKKDFGLKQSQIILHYNGIGFGYGKISNWWGPGYHSSISLSTNAKSLETFSLGSFKDIELGNFSIGAKIIAMPYKSTNDIQLYFSGLNSSITYNSKPKITLGLNRTFISGQIANLNQNTNFKKKWTISDAAKLVIEPLFGSSKTNLDYTIPGTPGFDYWDEVLTGYFKISFPELHLNVYADIASDDNRSNFTDLRAHWDHTLGYTLGINKFSKMNGYIVFTGYELLSTKQSNTMNPVFFRGSPSQNNFYTYSYHDYFSYEGRRIGAHSGTSSDDSIFYLGIGNNKIYSLISYNKERHGVNSVTYPELKYEFRIATQYNISSNHVINITLESERINNYHYSNNEKSQSTIIWLGYNFKIEK
tara:strand:+ start:41422 stop:42939 length:1518 start_codon:yes stop_codon:yes gene_type:complete